MTLTMQPIDYPFSGTPTAGTGTEIYDGIYWLRLPLPFALDHINVWLLDDGDSWTLIDTGPALREARDAWEELFGSVIKDKPVGRLIVTHYHPDHIGLQKWLYDRCQPDVLMSAPTHEHASYLLNADMSERMEELKVWCQVHDIPDPGFFTGFLSGRTYKKLVSGVTEHVNYLDDEEEITIGNRNWRMIMSHGHAKGHLSLYCDAQGLLISGDQVLPKITSNISLFENDVDANPLEEYLISLERIGKLPVTTTVLPSHGRVFRGLQRRISEIEDSHRERNEQILDVCSKPESVINLIDRIFQRKLDNLNWVLAFGETMAHLRYLEKLGRLRSFLNDGKLYYQRI